MPSLSLAEGLIALTVVTIGATVQGSIGFGLSLIAAPVLMLIERAFVPGPMLAAGVVLSILVAIRERTDIDVRGLRFALAGRVAGTLPAALALGSISRAGFDALFGTLVLAAVALSWVHRSLQPSPRNVCVAGAVSGVMGTISSIGGPPMALVYQAADGPRIRGTLSSFLMLGASLSIACLAAVGRFGAEELALTAVIAPGAVLGFACSRRAVPLLDRGATRPAVLLLSGASAAVILARALWPA